MHTPWIGRKFGIEMEMNQVKADLTPLSSRTLQGAVSGAVQRAGLPANRINMAAPSYRHSDGSQWEVKTDSSCGYGDDYGWEIASPAMTMDADAHCAELRAVCDAVAALEPRIDKKCGLHVHVEVADFTWQELQKLVILWARYEPFVFELCPPSRRDNDYCPPFRESMWGRANGPQWSAIERGLSMTSVDDFRRAMSSSPRGSLNLAHFWRSQRVEFRLGAGTVSYEKVRRWTQLLLTLVQLVKTNGRSIRAGNWSTKGFSVAYVAKMLNVAPNGAHPAEVIPAVSTELVAWMEARRAQFAAPQAARQRTNAAAPEVRPSAPFPRR